MQEQSFKNHIRYYAPHHFIFYPIVFIFTAAGVYFTAASSEKTLWAFVTIGFIMLFVLAFMMRQHYALTLQNRIVRLEIQFRYFVLTNSRLETDAPNLSDGQLFALRFASDAELPALVLQASKEGMSARAIKKSILDWRADHHRV